MSERIRRKSGYSSDLFNLLSEPIRRRVLVELARHDDALSVRSLATAVTGSETTTEAAVPVEATDPDAVVAELHHRHLPKLVEAGWVAVDNRSQPARYRLRVENPVAELRTVSNELDRIRATLSEAADAPNSRLDADGSG